ncbi:MAG: DegT/DnrJ/EryC1/StrS family aminotransferase [Acidobacteriia bacterium]|nr:DegT/DnrJ/EryC1/StrS family aminotransferase [Terriglobia bacterium]
MNSSVLKTASLDQEKPGAPIVLPSTHNLLAVDGGKPVIPQGFILHSRWPRIEPEDVEALTAILKAGLLTEMSGRGLIQQFESDIALYFGSRYAMGTNSGTAALHCALAGIGVEAGDEVIVPALSYIACAAAVLQQHAIPIFADVDPYTYNVAAETIEPKITPRTKAIMVVHLHGLPADMDSIIAMASRYGVPVLEDFSQAAGAAYNGRSVGGIGAVGAASLMAGKNLPSLGEGGILITNVREVRNRAASLKCFGEAIGENGRYSLIHETEGWNYRINVLSAAMVSRQLFRLDKYNDTRIASAAKIGSVLAELQGFSAPVALQNSRHVYHMYRFRFDPEKGGWPISADQARLALQQIFLAEGLPLVEFQNVPLPGHALLQRKQGHPWSCHQRNDISYSIADYPGSLDAIRHSLVVGYPAQAPLANPELVDGYVEAFLKLKQNFRRFIRIASSLPSAPPWTSPARLF